MLVSLCRVRVTIHKTFCCDTVLTCTSSMNLKTGVSDIQLFWLNTFALIYMIIMAEFKLLFTHSFAFYISKYSTKVFFIHIIIAVTLVTVGALIMRPF